MLNNTRYEKVLTVTLAASLWCSVFSWRFFTGRLSYRDAKGLNSFAACLRLQLISFYFLVLQLVLQVPILPTIQIFPLNIISSFIENKMLTLMWNRRHELSTKIDTHKQIKALYITLTGLTLENLLLFMIYICRRNRMVTKIKHNVMRCASWRSQYNRQSA